MKKSILFWAAILIICSEIFISCSKKDTQNMSSDNQTGISTLQIRLTDAPTAFEEVNVDIVEVNIKFADDSTSSGWVNLTTYPGIYNLLALQNGVDTLLATGAFPTQVVKEIRFKLGPNNSIKDGGIVYPLVIPGGSESGLKIKVSKKLSETLETIIIDFDAALSVKKEGSGDYKLRPVLRIK